MEFGLVMPGQFGKEWAHVVQDAQAAEDIGFGSLWLADHLIRPDDTAQGIFEGWTALAALAAETDRIRIGHLVNNVAFRNVGLLAKMAASLDHISDGRLELGLGAGWFEDEHTAFGYRFGSPGERVSALGETVDALDLLFTGEAVDYHGRFVSLSQAVCQPRPVQRPRPPISIAGGGPHMRRLAGEKADFWNCPAHLVDQVANLRATVEAAAGARVVRTTIQVPVAVGISESDAALMADAAAAALSWMGDLNRIGIIGTVDHAKERIGYFREQGADGIICEVPEAPMGPALIEALTEMVQSAED